MLQFQPQGDTRLYKLITEHIGNFGLEDVSFQSISEVTDTPVEDLNRRFKHIHSLIHLCTHYCQLSIEQELDRIEESDCSIFQRIYLLFSTLQNPKNSKRILYFEQIAPVYPDFALTTKINITNQMVWLLKDILQEGKRQGDIRPDLKSKAFAKEIIDLNIEVATSKKWERTYWKDRIDTALLPAFTKSLTQQGATHFKAWHYEPFFK